MEPTSFTVKEESGMRGGGEEFVNTKLMTRLTYTLDGVSGAMARHVGVRCPHRSRGRGGRSEAASFVVEACATWWCHPMQSNAPGALRLQPAPPACQCDAAQAPRAPHLPSPLPRAQMNGSMKVGGDGSVQFKEDDGLDYAATTVQLPGGERVAFLFTIKEFQGNGTLDSFSGDFTVPSYRGSTFLDPKVGGALGATAPLCCFTRASAAVGTRQATGRGMVWHGLHEGRV